MANENPLPEEIPTQRREPAIRPIAKKAYHKILKEKWEEIKICLSRVQVTDTHATETH